ncbi:MAG: heme-binding protein [Natronomonas sp.]|jgi:chlorite dismutase|uniref:heme-binding protein n=1 Tax=Natronomonas sp. TaxID=2184060 RepID=UPI0028703691|nr:heme-binding protein [Natronomonas sp.]MDR9430899.1 heme-binding protein [Natronomonas sp.]
MERRKPPGTEEGWYALHDLRRIDWDAWRAAPDRERERALEEGIGHLRSHVDLAEAEEGGSAVFSVVGHKADIMILHLRPTLEALDRAERRFEATAFAEFTERASSYVSVTEVSGYMHEELVDGIEDIEDAGMRNYMQQRIYPTIPDAKHVCFYPMDKRREPEYNWYDLPFDERAEYMSAHGDIGRQYAGKVSQIITGSVGLDDYEWGVTLFANDATDIKHLLYEMRFDPSSSKFAEFGPFYVGRQFPPEDLPALLAGEAVPTDGTDSASGSESGASADADHDGNAEHHDDGTSQGGGSSGRPDTSPAHEEVDTETLAGRLGRFGIDLDEHVEAGYGLLFTADADAEALTEAVEGLRGNFEHYDTHVLTAVRADSGTTAVISLWKNERAANTASGFLADLQGVSSGVGASLDGDGEADRGAAASSHGTDADDDIRGELDDLNIYAGKPHGEDVYAMVLYSEADVETVREELAPLAERFGHYDTHVKSAVYANEHGSERSAVVSLWETKEAADTASGFLAELPGVVARAGADERDGFGTMGMFYTVQPEYREDFVETFEEVGELLAGMDGHLETDLMTNLDDENDMFIASQWERREDAMAFFRSDAFRETVQYGREVLADRPRHVFLA